MNDIINMFLSKSQQTEKVSRTHIDFSIFRFLHNDSDREYFVIESIDLESISAEHNAIK